MICAGSIWRAMVPSGAAAATGLPSYSPPCFWKYHQGMPFCMVTMLVCPCKSVPRSGATAATWCAFTVSSTTSCGPASLIFPQARALECNSVPSSSISFIPWLRMASRFAPRAMNVTSSPAAASFVPRYPPIAPAPTMAILMAVSVDEFLRVLVGQATNAVDDYLDGGAVSKRARSHRSPAGDDVSGAKCQVPGNQADQPLGREDHISHRIVLPFPAIDQCAHAQCRRIHCGCDDRAEGPEAVEVLGARPLREARVGLQ